MFLKSVVVALVCIFRNVVGVIVLICTNIQVLRDIMGAVVSFLQNIVGVIVWVL